MTGRPDCKTGFHPNIKPYRLRHFLDGQRIDLYPALIQQPTLASQNVLRAGCLLHCQAPRRVFHCERMKVFVVSAMIAGITAPFARKGGIRDSEMMPSWHRRAVPQPNLPRKHSARCKHALHDVPPPAFSVLNMLLVTGGYGSDTTNFRALISFILCSSPEYPRSQAVAWRALRACEYVRLGLWFRARAIAPVTSAVA
jgi:hypothetical protein